jgi:methionyl-tRNA formyltransferase
MRTDIEKTVVVMGKGELAIKISDWFLMSNKYKLISIVPVIPEPVWTTSLLAWARSAQVPVIESGHYRDLQKSVEGQPKIDLVVSVFYDKIVKASFIDKCTRIINLHNGPLPKYRGVSPINWALKNSEIEHGITLHEITSGIDDGPIIAQLKYSIYPEFDEVEDIYKRSLEYGWVLFKQTMYLLDKIKARPQDDVQAIYYGKSDDERLGERRCFTRQLSADDTQ